MRQHAFGDAEIRCNSECNHAFEMAFHVCLSIGFRRKHVQEHEDWLATARDYFPKEKHLLSSHLISSHFLGMTRVCMPHTKTVATRDKDGVKKKEQARLIQRMIDCS